MQPAKRTEPEDPQGAFRGCSAACSVGCMFREASVRSVFGSIGHRGVLLLKARAFREGT